MPRDRRRIARLSLVGLALGGVAALLAAGPIPQPQEYHDYADRRAWLGVPNAADVLSNAAFLAVGVAGLAVALRRRLGEASPPAAERAGIALYAGAVALVAAGSVVYHLDPRDATLVWDRLPIAVAFSAFLSLVMGERLGEKAGARSLVPLVVAGVAGVLHWAWTLSKTPGGDLRANMFVKFLPAVAVPVMVLLVPEPRATRGPLLATIALFAAATAFELLDHPVFRATGGVVSGHTVKHLVAATAAWLPIAWYRRRCRLRAGGGAPGDYFHSPSSTTSVS